jgi:branched-chain amino acid transport system permease protein
MTEFVATLVAGIAQGVPLFLVASGLTLIFGVMHILNFAHGAFFMLGAYVLVSVLSGGQVSFALFLLAAVAAALVVGATGALSEIGALRHLYNRDHVITLLATYSLLLILEGAAHLIWGATPRSQRLSAEVAGSVQVAGIRTPVYDLFLILTGGLVALGLLYMLKRTHFGMMLRAVAEDNVMAQGLGVQARKVQIMVFVLGSALAGFSGALTAPLIQINTGLAHTFVIQSFAVVIIGGLGSLGGAMVGALLIGLAESMFVSYAPAFAGFSLYLAVAVVLLLRPQGLLGRRTAITGAA